MARNRKHLTDDGRPLTGFALSLRALWHEAGSPKTVKELAAKAGYAQPRLSELFNATKMPSEDLVRDVVQALGAEPGPWLERLEELKAAQAEFQAVRAREGDTLEARIARLEHENNRLNAALKYPDSVTQRALAASKDAETRIDSASVLERQARLLLDQAVEQWRRVHTHIPAVQGQAETILAEARAEADRLKLEGRHEHDKIVAAANQRAEELVHKAAEVAKEIRQQAIDDAKQHRAQAAASMDELLKEGDRIRAEHAREVRQADRERSTMVTRAKIEIELLVNEARKALEAAGEHTRAEDLDVLLRDFNISDSHPVPRGRHARRPPQSQDNPAAPPVHSLQRDEPEPADVDGTPAKRPRRSKGFFPLTRK
ncbi:hypothetical protein [Streptomyces chartreusis]|uniref:hypothetical protein n=1 Tax=Streptomyces chartreusis TaxID=1969 RepID=UPI00379E8E5D